MLDPIARNPKASIVPLIEIIDDSTFEFRGTPIQNIQVGGFDWNLIFNWHATPLHEMQRRKNKTDPIRYILLYIFYYFVNYLFDIKESNYGRWFVFYRSSMV